MQRRSEFSYATTTRQRVPQQDYVLPSEPHAAHMLAGFAPIGLADMDGVALLDRTDTKFVLSSGQIRQVLAAIQPAYRILEIDGVRLNPYQTLYFDTSDFALYMRHHAGLRNRYKVRSRQYIGSQLSFLEVKHKRTSNMTLKRRIETQQFITSLNEDVSGFVAATIPASIAALEAKLWNRFSRVALVNRFRPERLTLDFDLSFSTSQHTHSVEGIVIAEVKQQGVDRRSEFIQQMRAHAIHPMSFSKYCMGIAMLYPAVKHNNFKPALLRVEKLKGAVL